MSQKLLTIMKKNFEESLLIIENQYSFEESIKEELYKQLQKIADKNNLEFYEKGFIWYNWAPISFRLKQNPDYIIGFIKESRCKPFYYLKKEGKKEKSFNLEGMNEEKNKYYPYGYNFIKEEYQEFDSKTKLAIHNGDFKVYIEECITNILNASNFPKL